MFKKTMLAAALCLSVVATARAGVVTYNFNDGTLDGLVATNDPGYSQQVSGGVVTISNPSGLPNGSVILTAPFTLAGDFTASVVANRTGLGLCDFGIGTYGASPLMDMFCETNARVAANVFRPNVFNVLRTNDAVATVTLMISRHGTTITEGYNDGGGLISTSQTDPSYAGTISVNIFSLAEYGDSLAHTGTFDNFTITAAEVPEPASLLMMGVGAVALLGRLSRSPKR